MFLVRPLATIPLKFKLYSYKPYRHIIVHFVTQRFALFLSYNFLAILYMSFLNIQLSKSNIKKITSKKATQNQKTHKTKTTSKKPKKKTLQLFDRY